MASHTFAELRKVRATLDRREKGACWRWRQRALHRLVLTLLRGASCQLPSDRPQRPQIAHNRDRIFIGHHTVVIGRMLGEPPAVAPASFANRPDDFLIGPPSKTRFSIRRDVGSGRRCFVVQDIAGPERCWNGHGGVAMIERRMTPKASSDPVGEVSSSGNRRPVAD